MENTNIYLMPIMVAIIVILVNLIFSQRLKYDKRFSNELSNRLYALSFVKPFSWFINDDEMDERVEAENEQLKKARLDNLLNYRAYTTFKVLMFLVALVLYSIILLFLDSIVNVLDLMFRIENSTNGVPMETRIMIGVIILASLFIPKYYIQRRAKKHEFMFTQEFPVIQLSIILMLRARRNMNDILFTLGKNETQYKRIFQKAHRIYQRDKFACWEYLKTEFKDTRFADTLEVLASVDNFSRDETIRVLENGMEGLIEDSENQKQSGAAIGNLFSQFSMAVPFGGLMLLGAVPFAMYIFEMMSAGVSF